MKKENKVRKKEGYFKKVRRFKGHKKGLNRKIAAYLCPVMVNLGQYRTL